mgnify:CR=1 FL=1
MWQDCWNQRFVCVQNASLYRIRTSWGQSLWCTQMKQFLWPFGTSCVKLCDLDSWSIVVLWWFPNHSLWFKTREHPCKIREEFLRNQGHWLRFLYFYKWKDIHIYLVLILQSTWDYVRDIIHTLNWCLESWMYLSRVANR